MKSKPSYKTLEFWLSVAAFLVSTLLASGAFDPAVCDAEACSITLKVLGGVGAVLSALGYGGLRTKQKQDELKAEVAKTLADPTAIAKAHLKG